MRLTTYMFAIYFFLNGLYLLFSPIQFYTNTPGVAVMGPFNLHFITDVSFAFITAGIGLAWGAARRIASTAIVAALWPLLHALFHLQIWVKREFAMDTIFFSDFVAVIAPGFIAIYLAILIGKSVEKS